MSFLKITDPNKRDLIVKEYLATKKNIQRNNLEERLGKLDFQRELEERYKPITLAQEETQKELIQLKEALPAIEYFNNQKSITPSDITSLGPIASNYLSKYLGKKNDGDSTFGIYRYNDNFYIGDTPIQFNDDNINVKDKEYIGTPGLWELIVSKEPKDYTQQDMENYADILFSTNAMWQGNDPNSNKPKSSRSNKWNNIVKHIWKHYKPLSLGSGLIEDPETLVERFDLLMASKSAGNTGVKNELNNIVHTLLEQKMITKKQYNKLKELF